MVRAALGGSCLVSGENNEQQHRLLSLVCRTDIFILTEIQTNENVRACPHLLNDEEYFSRTIILMYSTLIEASFLRQKAVDVTRDCHSYRRKKENLFSDEQFSVIRPITMNQFNEMLKTYCDPVQKKVASNYYSDIILENMSDKR